MDKIFDLLDVGIAVLLVVIALFVQLQDNHRIHQKVTEELSESHHQMEGNLLYTCDGVELIGHLGSINQKQPIELEYQATNYNFGEFCRKILHAEIRAGKDGAILPKASQESLKKRQFRIYQKEGKWRIEE